jgi:hypothetical protein
MFEAVLACFQFPQHAGELPVPVGATNYNERILVLVGGSNRD